MWQSANASKVLSAVGMIAKTETQSWASTSLHWRTTMIIPARVETWTVEGNVKQTHWALRTKMSPGIQGMKTPNLGPHIQLQVITSHQPAIATSWCSHIKARLPKKENSGAFPQPQPPDINHKHNKKKAWCLSVVSHSPCQSRLEVTEVISIHCIWWSSSCSSSLVWD